VNGGEPLGLRERVIVAHTVGVRLRVLGKLVTTGVLVSVTVIDCVTVGDTRDTVPEVDWVGMRDGGIVNGGDRLGLRERVLVAHTVGVTLRVYCGVVARGVRLTVRERVRLTETVGLILRVFGILVTSGEGVNVALMVGVAV